MDVGGGSLPVVKEKGGAPSKRLLELLERMSYVTANRIARVV
jgi:hypothetical protein